MKFQYTIASIAATGLLAVDAFTTPCTFQQYKCGYNMVSNGGYDNAELTLAVNQTGPIPPLGANQLLQVLYRCINTEGGIVGNSYCISGCVSMPGLGDDQCAK